MELTKTKTDVQHKRTMGQISKEQKKEFLHFQLLHKFVHRETTEEQQDIRFSEKEKDKEHIKFICISTNCIKRKKKGTSLNKNSNAYTVLEHERKNIWEGKNRNGSADQTSKLCSPAKMNDGPEPAAHKLIQEIPTVSFAWEANAPQQN